MVNEYNLDEKACPMNERDMAEIMSVAKRKNVAKLNVAIVLISFLILFIFALIFIFSVDTLVKTPTVAVIVGAALLLIWIVLSIVFAKIIKTAKAKSLKKLRYKKRVMFLEKKDFTYVRINGVPLKSKFISVSENKNGNLQVIDYVVNNTDFLPPNISIGSIVYKCTKEMETGDKDVNCFFILQNSK